MVSRGLVHDHVYYDCRGGSFKLAVPFLRPETYRNLEMGERNQGLNTFECGKVVMTVPMI